MGCGASTVSRASKELPACCPEANRLFTSQKYEDALKSYKKWLDDNPDNEQATEVLYMIARILSKHGDMSGLAFLLQSYEKGFDSIDRLLEEPDFHFIRQTESFHEIVKCIEKRRLLQQGLDLVESKQFVKALNMYKKFVADHPDSRDIPDVHLKCAICLASLSELDRSLKYLKLAVEGGLQFEDGYLMAEPCFVELRARPEFQKLIEFHECTTLFDQGLLQYATGNISIACESFLKFECAYPSDSRRPVVLFYLGCCCAQQHKTDEALDYLVKSVDSGFQDSPLFNLMKPSCFSEVLKDSRFLEIETRFSHPAEEIT